MTNALATKPEQADLALAVKCNNVKAVEELLRCGADVNEEVRGESMLALATARGHVEMVRLLIDKGADVNKRATIHGKTPLIEAVFRNNIKMALLLIESGADIGARDENGKTALMYSSANVNIKIMQLLIDNGADVNARTRNGETALSIIEEKNRLVLERDIILSMAEEYCHEESVRLLKEAQAGQRQAQKMLVIQKQYHDAALKKQQRLNARARPVIRRPGPC